MRKYLVIGAILVPLFSVSLYLLVAYDGQLEEPEHVQKSHIDKARESNVVSTANQGSALHKSVDVNQLVLDPSNDLDVRHNLEVIALACPQLEDDSLLDDPDIMEVCWPVLNGYFTNGVEFYNPVDPTIFVNPHLDYNDALMILERDECNRIKGAINSDLTRHCQLSTLKRVMSFLSTCPEFPLKSDFEPLDRDYKVHSEESVENANPDPAIHKEWNRLKERFYMDAWTRINCSESGDWFRTLLPNAKNVVSGFDTYLSQRIEEYGSEDLQSKFDRFDLEWWDFNSHYKHANEQYLLKVLARLGDRLAISSQYRDTAEDPEFRDSVTEKFPEIHHRVHCPRFQIHARTGDLDAMRHCFYGHYESYVAGLSETDAGNLDMLNMYRSDFAEVTKLLTREQIDTFIGEYDGDFDMRFMNGPMQKDHKSVTDENMD